MANPIHGYNDKKYTEFAEESFSWKYIEKPTLIKLLDGKVNPNTKILDAGSGEGRSVRQVIEMGAKEENIVAIDLSQELLDNLLINFSKVKTVKSDVSKLEETEFEEQMDLITSNMVLDYLSDSELEMAIKNCAGWLKNGGHFVFGLSHPVREVTKINDLSHYLDRAEWMDVTPWGAKVEYNHRPISDYINVLIRNGLSIVRVEEPLIEEAGKIDEINYKKYSATPSRLFVLARK